MVSRWFFSGLPKETRFVPKTGIDEAAAKAHLRAILASFEPKHEHKEAGCAYLLSKWFEDVRTARTIRSAVRVGAERRRIHSEAQCAHSDSLHRLVRSQRRKSSKKKSENKCCNAKRLGIM